MTSTPITLTSNNEGFYVYDYTSTKSALCIASVLTEPGILSAYIVDSNLSRPVNIGSESGITPVLFVSCIPGMKIRIQSDHPAESITVITE